MTSRGLPSFIPLLHSLFLLEFSRLLLQISSFSVFCSPVFLRLNHTLSFFPFSFSQMDHSIVFHVCYFSFLVQPSHHLLFSLCSSTPFMFPSHPYLPASSLTIYSLSPVPLGYLLPVLHCACMNSAF